MPVTAITVKPPSDVNHPVVDSRGILQREFITFLLSLCNSFQLFLGDTTAGNFTQPLPLAASLPNQEVFAIKISSDGNTFSLSRQGADKINKQGAWGGTSIAVGTVQGAAMRLKSDGNSNWYVI